MRIYEFAQQKNILSKDIIEKLQENGFSVKNHMSVLDEKALAFLEKAFDKSDKKSHSEEPLLKNTQPTNVIEKTVSEPVIASQKTVAPQKNREKKEEKKPSQAASLAVDNSLVAEQMSVGAFAEKTKK